MKTSILSPGSMCQSVISGSLTLRDTKIRDFGVKFYFFKISNGACHGKFSRNN